VAWTWGGATGDDVTWTAASTFYASSVTTFVSGWFRPTTLTATRKLWSCNTTGIAGVEIDTTTTSIRMLLDGTVDGVWTAPAEFVANEWTFLAVANSNSSGVTTQAWRVWTGTFNSPPVEQTVTAVTAPTVSLSGNNAFYLGNAGTGTLAFQGDIADVWFCVTSTAANLNHPLYVTTLGTITNDEAALILETIVRPMWAGRLADPAISRPGTSSGGGWCYFPCHGIAAATMTQQYRSLTAGFLTMPITPTVNITTTAYQPSPRPQVGPSPLVGPRFPGRA
jgi:hypothetical protein